MTHTNLFWPELPAAAGGYTLHWSLALALAAVLGYAFQRYAGLPKVVAYALVGSLAGLLGLAHTLWPLQGLVLFLLELGVAIVLFECGARLTLRWFRHNPMVLVQSLLQSGLTYAAVYFSLRALSVPAEAAKPLALIAIVASPMVLHRVVQDTRAAGAVTDRAQALSTLATLYALTLAPTHTAFFMRPAASWWQAMLPALEVIGVSAIVALLLALLLRYALRFMSPTSENTSILLLTLIAASTALATLFGGSAPLAALLGGLLLKHLHPRPWVWPRQLGTAASLLGMMMFVLVSCVAMQAPWGLVSMAPVLALVAARWLASLVGVGLGHIGSGGSWRQAACTAGAMAPMSAVALLLASRFAQGEGQLADTVAAIALPTIVLMELLGAIVATVALRHAGEVPPHQHLPHDGGPRT